MGAPSSQIRLLLVEDVTQVAQYIRNLLNSQDQVKLLDVVSDGRKVLDQIRQLRPDVLMVDALLQGKLNGLEVAQRVRQAGLDIPIITLTVPQKPVKAGPGMRIVKVLAMPFSGFDFMNALTAASAEHKAPAPESLSRVYSVFAAKGGVGKTTIAFNLAVAARQQGYRVALVDGSLQFADLRALLRVPDSAPSLLQLPTDRITEADLEEVMWRDPSGIDILLAPPRVEMAEMVTTRGPGESPLDPATRLQRGDHRHAHSHQRHGAGLLRLQRRRGRDRDLRRDDVAQIAPHVRDLPGHRLCP